MFLAALFFTMYYFASGKKLFGIFSFGGWFTLSLLWLVLVNTAVSSGAYTVAFFWQAIGWVILLHVVVQWLFDLRQKKLGENIDLEHLP